MSDSYSAKETVAVVGLGKIGLPLAVQYASAGRHVVGCDINPHVVAAINAGEAHVTEEAGLAERVADLVARGLLSATSDTSAATQQARVVVIIVPVLIDEEHRPDFSSLDAATHAVAAGLQPGTLVIYETTVPVGTTAGRAASLLEAGSHLKAGRDFSLAFSPERVSSGHIFRDLRIYPKIVGGINESSTEAAATFYRSMLDAAVLTMASSEEAEFVKLIETTYRDVNIALANEFARYADLHGLDVARASAAANTQPYSHIHAAGVGVGGHCIPVYPYFLLASEERESPLLQLPRAARRINDDMADYAVQRIEAVTGSLAGHIVLILGVAYRDDVRETAFTSAKLLSDALLRRGASVHVDDPLFSTSELTAMGYTPFQSEDASGVRAIILQANHQAYQSRDFAQFLSCQVVLDGRSVLDRAAIEALHMRYITIGDGGAQSKQLASEAYALSGEGRE